MDDAALGLLVVAHPSADGRTVKREAQPGRDGKVGGGSLDHVLQDRRRTRGPVALHVFENLIEQEHRETANDEGRKQDLRTEAAQQSEDGDHGDQGAGNALQDVKGQCPRAWVDVDFAGQNSRIELQHVSPEQKLHNADQPAANAACLEVGLICRGATEQVGKDQAGDGEEHRCRQTAAVQPEVVELVALDAVLLAEGEVDEMAFKHQEDGHRPRHVDEAQTGWFLVGAHFHGGVLVTNYCQFFARRASAAARASASFLLLPWPVASSSPRQQTLA